MTIEASGRFTRGDIFRGSVRISRAYLWIFSVAGLLLLTSAIFEIAFGKTWIDEFPRICLGIFFLVYLWVAILYRSHRSWKKSPALQGTIVYRFDENGVAIEGPHTRGNMLWPAYLKWKEGKHSFFVYHNPRFANIIPKRFFSSPADVQLVRELLRDKINRK